MHTIKEFGEGRPQGKDQNADFVKKAGRVCNHDRKRELIAQAMTNKGAGVKVTPDPVTAERHREFMRTKKFTYGDYDPKR